MLPLVLELRAVGGSMSWSSLPTSRRSHIWPMFLRRSRMPEKLGRSSGLFSQHEAISCAMMGGQSAGIGGR